MMIKDDIAFKAKAMWESFDQNERTGVRIGMFPFHKMQAAEREGYNARELCVCLMNHARIDGGMIA